MPTYRIHRLKDTPQQQFRWAPHTSGVTPLKPKDYEPADEIDAATHYEAWVTLKGSPLELRVGDVLESQTGELRICKYIGFEEAHWIVPETAAPPPPTPQSIEPAVRES